MTADQESHILQIAALANDYCATLQNAPTMEKRDFVAAMLALLPRLYYEFLTTEADADVDGFFTEHLEEDSYMAVRAGVERLLGADDTYLETLLEEMKYSDTPIAASIAEGLADIFQDLYNFTEEVRLSEGLMASDAFAVCREQFASIWSFTLCNTLRALNSIYFSTENE